MISLCFSPMCEKKNIYYPLSGFGLLKCGKCDLLRRKIKIIYARTGKFKLKNWQL